MNLWQQFRKAWKQVFCRHQWNHVSTQRCGITRANGTKAGEVTLTLYECQQCGKDLLIPSNRTPKM